MDKSDILQTTPNNRYLQTIGGRLFFWLADTAWSMFHVLSLEEIRNYLEDRKSKGFNIVQAVALSENNGLELANYYGRTPLKKNATGKYDPTLPDIEGYSYWHHIDSVFDLAESLEMYIAFLPTWGDKFNIKHGKGPEIFTTENSRIYGSWLAQRYGHRSNLIWMLGGDRPLETDNHYAIIRAMKEGIQENEKFRHLICFHPPGNSTSSRFLPNEVDFHLCQSGHALDCYLNYKKIKHDYSLKPDKPVVDGEPRYEDIPKNFNPTYGFYNDHDVRIAAYWSVLSGAFGHTYGHSSIWCFQKSTDDYYLQTWEQALEQPGANHMLHLKNLITSHRFTQFKPCPEIVIDNLEDENYISACQTNDSALLYSPYGKPFSVNTQHLKFQINGMKWYNPRSGETIDFDTINISRDAEIVEITPPMLNLDWVLIVER
jgi:hypothetical protein